MTIMGCTPKTSQEFCKAGQKKMSNSKTELVADSFFRTAIQLDSNNQQAYFLLGDLYRMKWYSSKKTLDLNECRYFYLKAISFDSLNPQYWYSMGDTYEKEGLIKISKDTVDINPIKLKEAIYCFNKSIIADSVYESSYYGRSYCYNYLGDSISALRDLKKSCSLGNGVSCWLLKIREK